MNMSALTVGVGECTISRIIKAAKLSPAYDLLAGISGNWTKVANGLNTSQALKQKIRSDIMHDKMSDVDDILQLILTDWVGKESDNAKLNILTTLFDDNGMKDLATKIRAEFNATSSQNTDPAPISAAASSSVVNNVELVKKMKQTIRDNLADLIETTYLSAMVIAHLQSAGILSKSDERDLNSNSNSDDKNKRFYDKLGDKLGRDDPTPYYTFLEVMKKENQSGVCSYLKLDI